VSSAGAIRAGEAFVELYARDAALDRGLRIARQRVEKFAADVQAIGMRMVQSAALMAAPMALSVKVFGTFDDQMRTVKAVTGATADEFARLTTQAKELGPTTSFTARQVAEGQTSLGRAGFKPAEIEAAIPAVLNLARATGTELGEAAEIAAGAVRAFNLDAGKTAQVADVLTATANHSAQTLTDLGQAFSYVAPVAADAGESVESTAKALGVLANMQIKGSMAGTTLRAIMLQLADTTVQQTLHGIGIEAVDAQQNLRPVGDVLADIGRKMADLGTAQRISLAETLFGRRAVSGALKLGGPAELFDNLDRAIKLAAGTAARTAEEMDAGLGGAFRRLLSSVEGVAIAVGETLSMPLSSLADTIARVSQRVTEFVRQNGDLILSVAKGVASLLAAGAAMVGVAMAIKLATVALASPVAALLAVGVALTAYAADWGALLDTIMAKLDAVLPKMETFSATSGKTAQQLQAEHGAMRAKADRLAELRAKQQLTNQEMLEAKLLAHELAGAYPELTKEIDAVGTSAESTAKLFAKMQEALTAGISTQLTRDLRDAETRLDSLRRKEIEAKGAFSKAWDLNQKVIEVNNEMTSRPAQRHARVQTLEAKRDELIGLHENQGQIAQEMAAAADEVERLKKVLGEVKEIKDDMAAKPLVPVGGNVAVDAAEAYEKANARLMDDIRMLDANAIGDALERDLAVVDLKWRTRKGDAATTGEDRSMIGEAWLKEEALIRDRYRQEEIVKERLLAEDVARLRIEATKKGLEKELALIDLEEKRALAEASLPMVENVLDKFDLMRQMAQAGDVARTTIGGTFSGFAAERMGGGPLESIAETNRAIERHTAKMVEAAFWAPAERVFGE